MNTSDSILKEINEISPIVAAIGNRNGFQVPQGYFESQVDLHLQKAKSAVETENILPFSKLNHFNSPENYFKEFAPNLPQTKFDELVLDYSKINSFNVPENYFETLADKILAQTKLVSEEEKALEFSKVNAFNVPENYFDNLADKILAQTKLIGIEEEASEVSKINMFSVPENYFENNVEEILAKVKQSEKGKVVSLFSKATFKFAAAASVAALLIGVAIFFNQPNQNTEQALTAQDINAYLQNHAEEVEDLQLMENPVAKASTTKKVIPQIDNKKESEKKELKEYLENEVDESTLNDAI